MRPGTVLRGSKRLWKTRLEWNLGEKNCIYCRQFGVSGTECPRKKTSCQTNLSIVREIPHISSLSASVTFKYVPNGVAAAVASDQTQETSPTSTSAAVYMNRLPLQLRCQVHSQTHVRKPEPAPRVLRNSSARLLSGGRY